MPNITIPPSSPPLTYEGSENAPNRQRFQQWQIMIATLTLFLTAYFCTLGTIPAILALLVAKHVLVALLVMGLGVNAKRYKPFSPS